MMTTVCAGRLGEGWWGGEGVDVTLARTFGLACSTRSDGSDVHARGSPRVSPTKHS